MRSSTIFCTRCHTLLLEAAQCPKCGWKRPSRPPGEDKRLLWETHFSQGISSGLAWYQGALFFMDERGRIHALNAHNVEESLWKRPPEFGHWRIHEQVAVTDGILVLGAVDSRTLPQADKAVVALELQTGSEVWRRPLNVRQISDPLIAADRVFVATSSAEALALSLAEGDIIWRQSIDGIFLAAPDADERLVFFGSNTGGLFALNRENGVLVWSYRVEPYGSWPESIPYTPVVVDGVVYFTCWNQKTYALDACSGEVIWISEPTQKRPPMTPPLVTQDALYFAAHDRYVYALDRTTGQERWRTQLSRRSEVRPLLVDGILYVAARDHHLYALDAATGKPQEAPILTTGGKVSKAWAFDGTTLYLADDLGKLYAICLVESEGAGLSPSELMKAERWEEAAVAWALEGEYMRAAQLYAKQLGQPARAAQLYDKANESLLAAQQYEVAGDLKRALEHYRKANAWEKVAILSKQSDDLLGAAQAYEKLEQWDNAGLCYYELRKYARAVALYEQAARQKMKQGHEKMALKYLDWAVKMYTDELGQPVKAVMLLNEFGQKEAATELLQTIPGWKKEPWARKLLRELLLSPLERARLYEKSGDLLLAAKEYREAREHAKAADLLARAQEYALAAESYKDAGMPARAADMMVRMQNWDEAARLYLRADRPQEALQAYLKAGDVRNAAKLLEELGDWSQAAEKWEMLELWENAARAWEKAQNFERAAQAWEREGDSLRAAENYEEAARQQSLNAPHDREAMARYYELAMKQYQACGVHNKAAFCDNRRRFYRKQPLIQVDALRGVTGFTMDEWSKLDVIIANRGWGQAQDIRIQVDAQYFHLDASRLNEPEGLAKGVQTKYTLWLKPLERGTVPLHLTLTYSDQKGRGMPELIYDTEIKVRQSTRVTPSQQVIHVHGGDFIQAEKMEKQVGDRVDIRREGRGVSLDGEEAITNTSQPPAHPPLATRHPHSPASTITCSYCGQEQPATNLRCKNPRCGQPFIQCLSCGFYQPYHPQNRFCIHCGQFI